MKALEVKGQADAQYEKVKNVKMSKMAAVASIFYILTFLAFSNEPVFTSPLGGGVWEEGEGLHLSFNKKLASRV